MTNKNELFFNELNKTNNTDTEAKMYRRDSTKRLPILPDFVDLIISSPPYVTSYEYADLHQLSLLWFADDTTLFHNWARLTQDFDKFRETFVGTNRKRKYHDQFDSSTANDIIVKLANTDKPTADSVSNYFLDMRKAFNEMHRILKPGAKACLIIGNTNLSGVEIRNAEVAAEQLDSTGFEIVNTIKRTISNKMITPWRDSKTGKFTNLSNANKKPVYQTEYIIVAKKN
jgi:DNA modification methylase